MIELNITINIISLLLWAFCIGHAIRTSIALRNAKDEFLINKRHILVFSVIPSVIAGIMYYYLLITWLLLNYDERIDMKVSLMWSVFHLFIPLIVSFSQVIINYILDYHNKKSLQWN